MTASLQTQHNFSFVNFLRTVSIIIWRMTTEELRCRKRWPFFRRWMDSNLLLSFVSCSPLNYYYYCCWPIYRRYYCCRCSFDREKASGFLCVNRLVDIYCSEIIYRCILIYCTLVPASESVRIRQRKAFAQMKFHRIRSRWVFASVNRTKLKRRKWEEKKSFR